MLFKVMIVDDESWIRKGMRAAIQWEQLGLTPDSEASDGLEALQAAEERAPDILLTDVRMPGIDGLQLAEKMLEMIPHLKVIVVSGYSEFEYVKSAIQLDAVSYILKPINPQEMNAALERAVRKLSAEIKERKLAQYLPGYLEKLTADLCRESGAASGSGFLEALQLEGAAPDKMACVLFHYEDAHYDAGTIAQLVKQAADKLLYRDNRLIIWDRSASRLWTVMLADGYREITDMIRNLLLSLKQSNVNGVWAAVGGTVEAAQPALLGRSCREAIAVTERYALQRTEDVIAYTSDAAMEQGTIKFPLQLQKQLNEALSRHDQEGCHAVVDAVEAYYRDTAGATIRHARSFFLAVVSDTVKFVMAQPVFHEAVVAAGFDFCLNIEAREDLKQMADWLRGYLRDISRLLESANQRDVHRNIVAAADYIREHYAEEISLNAVSTRYFITSTYFSSMFKEIIGENFLEFLTGVRMEKAKELLRRTDLKVGLISERVGYADSRYFSKLFKKTTGLMPTEFRQSQSDSACDREGSG